MDELTRELRLLAPAVDHAASMERFDRLRQVRRRRRRSLVAASSAALLVLVGVAAIRLVDAATADTPVVADRDGDRTTLEDIWRPLRGAPSIDDATSSVVWTGDEFLIWTGEGQSVAYTPDGASRRIPPAPIPDREGPGAVNTEEAVFFWGGVDAAGARADGAMYDLASDSWTLLPPAPLPAGAPLATVWTGSEVLVVGSTDRSGAERDLVRGAAFDPETQRWRRLPDAPMPLNVGNGTWTGSDLVIVGSRLDGNNADEFGTVTLAYNPEADAWTTLPSPGLSPQSMWVEHISGELIAWDYLLQAAVLADESPRWLPLESIPLAAMECSVQGAGSARRVLVSYCGSGAVLDPSTKRWTPITMPHTAFPPTPTSLGMVVFDENGGWLLPYPERMLELESLRRSEEELSRIIAERSREQRDGSGPRSGQ